MNDNPLNACGTNPPFSGVPIPQDLSNGGRTSEETKKGDQVASNRFTWIGQGAIKVVWVRRGSVAAPGSDSSQSVYYTPVNSFFGRKAQELKKEVEKMDDIKSKFTQGGNVEKSKYLAVEFSEVKKNERNEGKYTVKTQKAEQDFEKRLRDSQTLMDERISLGGNLLMGLRDLHSVGYVHGDMKPENCLIYKEQDGNVLKISDFGKAKALAGKDSHSYRGNMRFAPPEGRLSVKSDVYGAAMILIRNFEESLGFNESLVAINPDDLDKPASTDLRGIEKYVVESKAFLATNSGSKSSLWTKLERRFSMGTRSAAEKDRQKTAMDTYINALTSKLKEQNKLTDVQASGLNQLLKKMTATDPSTRLTAEEASEEYQKIFMPV